MTIYDSRAQVRAALASWPDCSCPTRAWLEALPWRVRECVQAVHGDKKHAGDVAIALGCSISTVRGDLRYAYLDWQRIYDAKCQELVD